MVASCLGTGLRVHELVKFRTEAAAALAPLAAALRSYVEMVADVPEAAGEDNWVELCGQRSAIAILLDHYAGAPAVAEFERADVVRLDGELRRLG